jgi:cytochrome c biogenesis factor
MVQNQGLAIAHSGVAMSMLGIISAGTWGTERIIAVKPTQTVSLSGYEFFFDELVQRPGPNYNALVARFTVRSAGVPKLRSSLKVRARHLAGAVAMQNVR